MTTSNTSDAYLLFASPICRALAEGLTQTCNVAWQCGDVAASPSRGSLQSTQEIYRLTFDRNLEGRCFLAVLSKEQTTAASGTASGIVAASVQIMLQRIQVLLRASLGEGMVALEPMQAEAVPADQMMELHAELHSEEAQLSVRLLFDTALVASLRQPHIERLLKATVTNGAFSGSGPANLDLVMDVALSVSLRFGRRQMPLRDVIELTSGSVVELDRQVDEPVELVLDGQVVARGEAVIIDGNYGMRVTQIVQPLLNV